MKSISGIHNAAYRASGGRIGGQMLGMPVLLLVTKGRRSGKPRTIPLLYIGDGEAIVVVASNGGSDYVPAWWLNLRASPEAEVEIGRGRTLVTAREASSSERARLWPEFTSRVSAYADYANRTAREIPVVILEPRSAPKLLSDPGLPGASRPTHRRETADRHRMSNTSAQQRRVLDTVSAFVATVLDRVPRRQP
jgi:F420H(2)-dependent quinone reductase